MSFKNFNLDSRILKAVEEAGYKVPTPIQESVIPILMNGDDVRASAQTGTGKTAAFLIPSLHRIMTEPAKEGKGPRIVILTPTRELAMQVANEAEKYARHLPKVKVVCIYGGAPFPPQKRDLARPYEILVATPGRLIDHMEEGRISLGRVDVLILDEADRMLDMGFIEPVEQIVADTPATRQTLLFSATLKGSVLNLSKRLMNNPKEVCVIPAEEKYDHIKQEIYHVDHVTHKLDLLKHLLDDSTIRQAIIFTATKRFADELTQELRDAGHQVSALHGDMNQSQRARTLGMLRQGRLRFLVATDVAARGIDVSTITHVFNFDLPRCVEDYTHRIGRTGRAGATGVACSFATPKERMLMKQIETSLKQKLQFQVAVGFEPKSSWESGSRGGARAPFGKKKPFFNNGPRSGSGNGGRNGNGGGGARSSSGPRSNAGGGGRFR